MNKILKRKRIKHSLVMLLLFIFSVSFMSCNSSDSENSQASVDEDENTSPVPNTFRNPVLDMGPDPWVIKDGDEYFVTFTTGDNITLVRTNKMSDLKTGEKKVVWTPPSTGMNSKEIWAPELHKLDGVWYIYYAASNGDNSTHRMWVLENTASNPLEGEWVDKGELKLPDDKWAIDGSPFKLNEKDYFVWSGWDGDNNVRQDIYIAEMENPLSVKRPRVCLLKPAEPWESNGTNPQVVEGPQFLLKNDKAFLFYSAGGCWTDGYSIGALVLESNQDPMDANSWNRLGSNPLFKTNTTGNASGPGHNSFFKSLNGDEDWILYHANPSANLGCANDRSVRMQKMSWDAEGLPELGSPEPLQNEIVKPSGEITD